MADFLSLADAAAAARTATRLDDFAQTTYAEDDPIVAGRDDLSSAAVSMALAFADAFADASNMADDDAIARAAARLAAVIAAAYAYGAAGRDLPSDWTDALDACRSEFATVGQRPTAPKS